MFKLRETRFISKPEKKEKSWAFIGYVGATFYIIIFCLNIDPI